MKKKISILMLLLIGLFSFTACGKTAKTENVKGTLDEIMAKVYENIDEEELPMALQNIAITEENMIGYLGTEDITYKEAIASESQIGSIAHSVVLIRLKETATSNEIEETKETIKKNADPRKWICVEAENVYVENNGNIIILIMSNENADKIKENFKNLK